jgi:Phosphotransferase enzyme family
MGTTLDPIRLASRAYAQARIGGQANRAFGGVGRLETSEPLASTGAIGDERINGWWTKAETLHQQRTSKPAGVRLRVGRGTNGGHTGAALRSDLGATAETLPVNRQNAAVERRLAGGNAGGAVLVDGTVRRAAGAWTPAVHALLEHLHQRGFERAPRPLGFDEHGREVLTYLPGVTVGDQKPWPLWVHADATLVEVADWLREYHRAVTDFVPPSGSVWRLGGHWTTGQVICHNDAAPYNAAWHDGQLSGFFDWDFAGPALPEWDLAFTAFAWVPLHARHVVGAEGFTAFDDRRRRLEVLLARYGWDRGVGPLLEVLDKRLQAHKDDVTGLARAGDPFFQQLIDNGAMRDLQVARTELADL